MMSLHDIALTVACAFSIILYEVVLRALVVTTPLDGPIVGAAFIVGSVIILDTFLSAPESGGDRR